VEGEKTPLLPRAWPDPRRSREFSTQYAVIVLKVRLVSILPAFVHVTMSAATLTCGSGAVLRRKPIRRDSGVEEHDGVGGAAVGVVPGVTTLFGLPDLGVFGLGSGLLGRGQVAAEYEQE